MILVVTSRLLYPVYTFSGAQRCTYACSYSNFTFVVDCNQEIATCVSEVCISVCSAFVSKYYNNGLL